MRVLLQHDAAAGFIAGDHEGAIVEARRGGCAVEHRALHVFAGIAAPRGFGLDMRRQQTVPLVVGDVDLVQMQRGGVVIGNINGDGAAPGIAVAEA